MFGLAGSVSIDRVHGRAANEISDRVLADKPLDEVTLTRIAVEERARKATLAYRADCLGRRLGILYRELWRVKIGDFTSRRKNSRLYLVKDVEVRSVEQHLRPPLLRDVG